MPIDVCLEAWVETLAQNLGLLTVGECIFSEALAGPRVKSKSEALAQNLKSKLGVNGECMSRTLRACLGLKFQVRPQQALDQNRRLAWNRTVTNLEHLYAGLWVLRYVKGPKE